ncbi:uncharacterized protein YALI1_B02162g [Yarrowia lipolytica]|uniref:Uncharacterized protein n=1 Tax=Yarrowia lipolytica TaxID=4952 RepID=A0A1D8N614_YARLL|nr:hypothetical protein YALI1_B02162g [Yarrowia lipolytica]
MSVSRWVASELACTQKHTENDSIAGFWAQLRDFGLNCGLMGSIADDGLNLDVWTQFRRLDSKIDPSRSRLCLM